MGFRKDSWATVWSVEPGKGNFTKVRLSVSRKNKETGMYEQDFSGFCMFIGTAHAMASRLKERDRIQLGDIDVTTTFSKEHNKEFVDYKVFSFKMQDDTADPVGMPSAPIASNPAEGEADEETEMPF